MRVLIRLFTVAALLYLGFAAHHYYVEHHPDPKDNPCSCDDCDCVSDFTSPKDAVP